MMDRRAFCRNMMVVGGSLFAVPLLKACGQEDALPQAANATPNTTIPSSPSASPATGTLPATATNSATPTASTTPYEKSSPTPMPTATVEPAHGPGVVALVSTRDRAEGVRRAVALLQVALAGRHILLKPNFNSADPAPGSTHPDVLRTLVELLADQAPASLTVADRSGMGDTRAVMEQKGIFTLADEFGFAATVFDELPEEEWVLRRSPDFHWQNGFRVPRLLLDTEAIVQTCNLKTHRYGGHFTLSLKNSVGFAANRVAGNSYMQELHNSPYQRQMIAEINTAYEPALVVLDGVEAFVRGGPATGERAAAGVVLAATDRVALDAVGVALLRLLGTTPEVSRGPIFAQEQIARAAELELGVTSPEAIRIITDDAASEGYARRVRQMLQL